MPSPVAVGSTLSERLLGDTIRRAKEFTDRGFGFLKLKGGIDFENDKSHVLEVRRAVGDGIERRFDANQGWSVDEARHFAKSIRPTAIELLEQPTRRDKPDLLGRVATTLPVPVMGG